MLEAGCFAHARRKFFELADVGGQRAASQDDNAESTTAFTRRGLDYLDELLDKRRSDFMQER